MSPQRKKKLETAIDNLFSSSRKESKIAYKEDPQEEIQETLDFENNSIIPPNGSPPSAFQAPVTLPDISFENQQPVEPASPEPIGLMLLDSLAANDPLPFAKEKSPESVSDPTLTSNPISISSGNKNIQDAVETQPPSLQIIGEGIQVVIFTLEGQHYGIRIESVESIIKMQPITELPHVASYILGLTNLRGKVLPVLSLRTRFGLPDQEPTKNSRIIVIRADQVEAGLIVDGVTEVEMLPASSIEPAPAITTLANTRYMYGIAKLGEKLIILLDLVKVLLP